MPNVSSARYGDTPLGAPSVKQQLNDVGTIVWGGVAPVAGFGRNVGKRAGRFLFGGKSAPKSTPKPGGVLPNPAQAGDDVVRRVNDISPSVPVAGRTYVQPAPVIRQPLAPWAKNTLAAGAGVGAVAGGIGYLYRPSGGGGGGGAGPTGPEGPQGPLGRFGDDLQNLFGDLGGGLAELFASTGTGVGIGAGTGAYQTLAGVGEGLKKVLLPAMLLGGGFLVFTALKKK